MHRDAEEFLILGVGTCLLRSWTLCETSRRVVESGLA